MTHQIEETLTLGDSTVTLREFALIATGKVTIKLSDSQSFKDKILHSQNQLSMALKNGIPVYGVTTGYGKSCGKRMALDVALKNGNNLIKFHGCGTGEPFGITEIRAAMAARLICFCRGYSGVSFELIQRITDFLNYQITPVVPQEGSVGASGDLTPLSYLAASLIGDRYVYYKGKIIPASEAIAQTNLPAFAFAPKEPLALMNGTSVMTGVAIMAIMRAENILTALISASAMTIHALMGNAHHYHPTISKAKPHPGQDRVARSILQYLETSVDSSIFEADALETLQDPYSIRCSPQVLGVLADSLNWISEWITIEANSANDNPIIDPDSGEVLMGGNFYGGHVGFAMDGLKSALASAADMSDRQVALLVDSHMNRGLPQDLVRVEEKNRMFNHGFKAMSIAASALAAESLKLTMPATAFSRSTESHNQDKVSMGTIAARDALRACELAERLASIHLLAAAQACEIRNSHGDRPGIGSLVAKVRSCAQATFDDRPMDADIATLSKKISEDNIFSIDQ